MDFKTITIDMYPYWLLGIAVVSMVLAAGKKRLLRIETRPVLIWSGFMILITLWRIFLDRVFKYHGSASAVEGMLTIPWTASFTIFWEDLCHGLPLLILQRLLGENTRWNKWFYRTVLTTTALAFGLGHLYQGVIPAIVLCMYIPYSVDIGRRYGFGTVILCHTIYDLSTLLSIHYLANM